MSVGAKIKYKPALDLVHRGTVRGETVLPYAGWNSATPASDDSHHQGGRRQHSDMGTAPFETSDTLPNSLPPWGRCVESP